jgi:hypothetical protein
VDNARRQALADKFIAEIAAFYKIPADLLVRDRSQDQRHFEDPRVVYRAA